MFKLVSGCALGLAASLAVTAPAAAQWQQTQYNYVIDGMRSGGRYYGGGYYNNGATYAAPMAAPDYASYYAPQPEFVVPRGAALIDLRVPANAEVWFSGDKTQQTGADRSFVTPSLDEGHNYAYRIKVAWTDAKGQRVEREKKVAVRPGARLNLQFE